MWIGYVDRVLVGAAVQPRLLAFRRRRSRLDSRSYRAAGDAAIAAAAASSSARPSRAPRPPPRAPRGGRALLRWRRFLPRTVSSVRSVPPAEIDIDEARVRRLLEEQHRDLAGEPLEPAASGWDNARFRLGDALAVRLPRRASAVPFLEREQRWLP